MQKKVIEPNIAPKIKTKRHSNGGVKSKTTYVNGKEHGVDTGWREDGSKRREITWRDGKEHGRETGWYEDGRKCWELIWRAGRETGVDTWWYESGEIEKEIYYIAGHEYARIEWDEEGNVSEANFLRLIPIKNKQSSQKFPTLAPVAKQLRENSRRFFAQ